MQTGFILIFFLAGAAILVNKPANNVSGDREVRSLPYQRLRLPFQLSN